MSQFFKSNKLKNVFYDIRGPVLSEVKKLEDEGHRILKLNIGNPAPFGLNAPDELIHDVIMNLPEAEGYCDSKGLFSARKAVMQYMQQRRVAGVTVDDIIMGNGVSELIVMATQGLLNNGDEVLIPAPDYPLWTGAVTLAGGVPVHYRCNEDENWFPDVAHIRASITPRTKALVIINPNNPTGAVYSEAVLLELIELARQHHLVILSDEIYDKILFDGAVHTPTGALCDDVLILTFNGLSKTYRLAGFRSGWMVISGPKERAKDLIEGLNMLASMRLCANVPAQLAVQSALGGYQSINELVLPGGRIYEQRQVAVDGINAIPGLSAVAPMGALYLFCKMDPNIIKIDNDERMVLDLLRQEQLLLVHGRAFHWDTPDHFRLVFLPTVDVLNDAIGRLRRFFAGYSQ